MPKAEGLEGCTILLAVLGLLLAPPGIPAGAEPLEAQAIDRAYRIDAVFRPGYHGAWRADRDGSSSETHDLRMRAQLGGWWTPLAVLALRARVAGRLSTEQETFRFHLRDHVPTTDGLRLGEATVDELHLRWRPSETMQLRLGRMQTSFELAGVPRKSLDRNDSPNTDVTWTDGVHAWVGLGEGWRQHVVVQRNGKRGPTNAVRGPLEFSSSRSRVTLFGSIQAQRRFGPFIQREVDLTYIPGAVPGPAGEGGWGDYVALVVRAAGEPSVQLLGGRLVLATEVGVASGTPARTFMGTGTSEEGNADGWAFQLSANLMDIPGGHSVGVVHSQAGDGWLISPDIRENNREMEARYYLQYAPWGRLDLRVRHREDMRRRPDALRRRTDRDVYVRTTLRF
jgi:hypothetical protein